MHLDKRNSVRMLPVATSILCGLFGAQLQAADSITIADPKDIGDRNGDIRSVGAHVRGDTLFLSMTVDGSAAPAPLQTAEGMVNRHYYHWLIDTDNNPATGRSNAEYEGTPTGLTSPLGAERVIMVGWRDGKPNGVYIYDPLDEENPIASTFSYLASGNSLVAAIPLSTLGLTRGQTVAVSAFQEGASEDWTVDWVESAAITLEGTAAPVGIVDDPVDMADSSGDIRQVGGRVVGDQLLLWLSVEGVAGPSTEQTPTDMSNRYYYHWLLDTDNNPATGRSNAEYEGTPTGLANPIGAERVIMVGWRDGKPNGIEAYDPLDEENPLISGFPFQVGGNTVMAMLPLSNLGLIRGQNVTLSAFQEGASDDWAVDWLESAPVALTGPNGASVSVADPADLPDTSGDIRSIGASVHGDELHLTLTVTGVAAPSVEQTPTDKSNRYYYHWLLDTDNNPATGRSNTEYEGIPTGLSNPIGAERVIMLGWRDGKPNGLEVYDPLDEENPILTTYQYGASGNTVTAVFKLSDLGLTAGQTIRVSAFQEGASDDWMVDWVESAELVLDPGSEAPVISIDDPEDMADPNGDIKRVEATIEGTDLVLRMWAYGQILPLTEETVEGMVNRYYYHWLVDTDNNPATGRSNSEYEGNPTGLSRPIGSERVIMVGWRNGAIEGREVYDPLDEDTAILRDFDYTREGGMMEVKIPFSALGIVPGQTVAISAFQEGASNDWQVDWVESEVLTLGAPPSLSLESSFEGDSYGFKIILQDEEGAVADQATVEVLLDGSPVTAEVGKSGGTTTIAGAYPALLEPGSIHEVTLSVEVSGEQESRTFVYQVAPYTVLNTNGKLNSLDTANSGFLTYLTSIPSWQSGVTDLLEGKASIAEMQLAGQLKPEGSEIPYYNEADYDGVEALWKGPGFVEEGVINWFDQAPGLEAPLNFGQDSPLPFDYIGEGIVAEILTYLHLEEGSHKLGLLTEGGHKVSQGFTPTGQVISLFDNSEAERIPTYFARNQFFDVVAPEEGYYPIRILWFQDRPAQEPGIMLEFFSVKGQTLHLVNDPDNPDAIKAYRAGILLSPGEEAPTVSISRDGNNLVLTWIGGTGAYKVERKNSLDDATWTEVTTTSETTAIVQMSGDQGYFRVSGGNAPAQ